MTVSPPTSEPIKPSESTHAFTGLGDTNQLNPMFARAGEATDFPLDRMPDGESLPETAYQIVHDEAMLDGNARLNLATFVGTWMDPYASKLYSETADKNMIDKDEYPQTAAIETRCWTMLAEPVERARAPRAPSARRRSARPRRACSAASRSSAVGSSPAGRPASRPRSRTSSSPAPCRCAGRSSATTGTSRRATCRSPTSTRCSTGSSSRSTSTRTRSASSRSWA